MSRIRDKGAGVVKLEVHRDETIWNRVGKADLIVVRCNLVVEQDVQVGQQRDADVQKNMASMVAAPGGGPVLAAG